MGHSHGSIFQGSVFCFFFLLQFFSHQGAHKKEIADSKVQNHDDQKA